MLFLKTVLKNIFQKTVFVQQQKKAFSDFFPKKIFLKNRFWILEHKHEKNNNNNNTNGP